MLQELSFSDWARVELKAPVVGDYWFPLEILPMQQGHGKKHLNRTYKQMIADAIKEQDPVLVPKTSRVGLCIVFFGKFHGDLSNCLKMIEDGIKKHAFVDDIQVDCTLVVRCPTQKPGISVKVMERK